MTLRRIVVLGAVVGLGAVAVRRGPKLAERLMARCEQMMDHMPDTFPPKRAMKSIEETRRNTARILELLEASKNESSTKAVDDAA